MVRMRWVRSSGIILVGRSTIAPEFSRDLVMSREFYWPPATPLHPELVPIFLRFRADTAPIGLPGNGCRADEEYRGCRRHIRQRDVDCRERPAGPNLRGESFGYFEPCCRHSYLVSIIYVHGLTKL